MPRSERTKGSGVLDWVWQSMTPDPFGPTDPVDASVGADLNKHFNAVDATFVETMLNAGGMGKVGSKGIIVEWNTTGWLDRAIAHEIGHNAGITHSGHSSQDNHLMHSSYLQAKDTELKASDVSYFD